MKPSELIARAGLSANWQWLGETIGARLNPQIQSSVLQALGDPKAHIIHGTWADAHGDGCLFTVALAAAQGVNVTRLELNMRDPGMEWMESTVKILGLSADVVQRGIDVWDDGSDEERVRFLECMRYLARKAQATTTGSPLKLPLDLFRWSILQKNPENKHQTELPLVI